MHAIEKSNPTSAGSLDPQDWEEIRRLGHRMVNDLITAHRDVRDRPVWQRVPDEVRESFSGPVPRQGAGPVAAYREYEERVKPWPLGNVHPRFWGWVLGSGTPLGALAELAAATMNPNLSGLRNAGVHVEEQVIDWLKEMLGYPETASGILVSGGSMANTMGLAVGIQTRAGFDVAREGLSRAPKPLVLYASTEAHYSVVKTARMLGLGDDALRRVPADDEFKMDLAALERAIAADRAAGYHPFGVVGNAGSVNTGAFDDLDALADIAQRENLWFHIDGAFGAFAALDEDARALTHGMERADSLAFDLHKWMCIPIECGCLLVRDADAHRRAYSVHAEYLTELPRGVSHDNGRFASLGPQLTRSFRALKVWMSLIAHGADAFATVVRDNIAQAGYLTRLVDQDDRLERLAPTASNVVCFRYVDPDLEDDALDTLNRGLLMELQEQGIAVPSHTVLNGRFAIRVAITNHRTRNEDLDLFVRETLRLGASLLPTLTAGTP